VAVSEGQWSSFLICIGGYLVADA